MQKVYERKVHKKLDRPPKNLRMATVECLVEYPTVVTDHWFKATCKKCQLNNPENKNAK